MVSTPEDIVRTIQDYINDADVTVTDLRGDGRQYAVHVASSAFRNLSRIDQHKLVYKSLEGKLKKDTISVAIQTAEKDKEVDL